MEKRETELEALTARWEERPTAGSGIWLFRIAVKYGDGETVEVILTREQAKQVAEIVDQLNLVR